MRTKMAKKSSGFTLVEVLLFLIFIGIVVLIVWRVIDSHKQPVATTAKQPVVAAPVATKPSSALAADVLPAGEIKDLGTNAVSFVTVTDIDKLPPGTPASFREYMKLKLAANKTVDGCVGLYTINKLSTVNVAGGVGDVDAKTYQAGVGNCGGGGAKAVWSFANGTWQENGFQALPLCSLLVKANIYQEFVEQCSNSSNALVTNPNGSIAQLKK